MPSQKRLFRRCAVVINQRLASSEPGFVLFRQRVKLLADALGLFFVRRDCANDSDGRLWFYLHGCGCCLRRHRRGGRRFGAVGTARRREPQRTAKRQKASRPTQRSKAKEGVHRDFCQSTTRSVRKPNYRDCASQAWAAMWAVITSRSARLCTVLAMKPGAAFLLSTRLGQSDLGLGLFHLAKRSKWPDGCGMAAWSRHCARHLTADYGYDFQFHIRVLHT